MKVSIGLERDSCNSNIDNKSVQLEGDYLEEREQFAIVTFTLTNPDRVFKINRKDLIKALKVI